MRNSRRFFFHYRRVDKKMTIHFNKVCYTVDEIDCRVPCETKRNKTQPYLVMRGFCSRILVEDNKGYII